MSPDRAPRAMRDDHTAAVRASLTALVKCLDETGLTLEKVIERLDQPPSEDAPREDGLPRADQ